MRRALPVVLAFAICVAPRFASAADTSTELIFKGNGAAAVTADAHFLVFADTAVLLPGDTNGTTDVYVFDRGTGALELASVSTAGVQGDDVNGGTGVAVSADGRYVAFVSASDNLDASVTDGNGWGDVFLRDRVAGTTVMVSTDGKGHAANDFSTGVVFSANGRYLLFNSFATDLVPLPGGVDANEDYQGDVYLYDIQTKAIELISRNDDGAQGDGASGAPSVSGDGRFVAFTSHARNLDVTRGVFDDSWMQLFLRDREAGTTRLLSVNAAGERGNGNSVYGALSRNGRYVAFDTEADNLFPGDDNGWRDVLLLDVATGTMRLATVATDGGPADYVSAASGVSEDGRFVLFQSLAGDILPGVSGAYGNCYVRDMLRGRTELVNVSTAGAAGDYGGGCVDGGFSPDGRYVVFASDATNLYPGDTLYTIETFLRDRGPQTGESDDGGCDDIDDLRADVSREAGWLPGMTPQLKARLKARLAAAEDDCQGEDEQAARARLASFRTLVEAKRGGAISERTASRWKLRSKRALR